MEAVLLVIVVVLLVVDLDEHSSCHDVVDSSPQPPSRLRQTLDADQRIQTLTNEAAVAMLDEIRRQFDQREGVGPNGTPTT